MTKRTNTRKVVYEVLEERDKLRAHRVRRRLLFWLFVLITTSTGSYFYHHEILSETIKIMIACILDLAFEW